MNILLVDDDSVDREIVKRALRSSADISSITEAKTAEEGLIALENKQFDVILLDYMMPQIDGIEMVITLRNKPNLGDTAIVMISISDDEQLAIECLQAGAQDFVAKTEISPGKMKRAIVQAQKRFELEKKLFDSYCQVRELAEKDSLTGLSNRYHFEKALKIYLSNNIRSNKNVALLLLDLDHFKNINDSYGHDAGDELLKKVVDIINDCLRGNELFARLGGDEFAILLSGISDVKEASKVAERIIGSLEDPLHVKGNKVQCGVSIGIAMHPENASTSESLVKYADIAMYRAKHQGRNRYCFFQETMQQQLSRAYQIKMELDEAIKKQSFELHYQPVINTQDKEIVGVEALIRWPSSSVNSTPDEFIPIAEESRSIIKLGQWVFDTAIEQLASWQKDYKSTLTMAINISAVQLSDDSLASSIQGSLKRHGVSPEHLILEITETALFSRSENAKACLQRLSELGCKIALDDFGTGYSSISHLMNYPINIVKFDKTMLPESNQSDRYTALMRGLSSMVNIIGLDIIAEGVETEFHWSLCEELSIKELQGFYFSKPLLSSELTANWLA
ncbi:GGDEF domain-containing response regulator [Alteromonadaceae bacterium M269]|nr:GGDEF domain-containing response regulator [Alteromonadaceae bacterium M269]